MLLQLCTYEKLYVYMFVGICTENKRGKEIGASTLCI